MNVSQRTGALVALVITLAGSSLARAGAAPDPAPAATETPGGAGLPADVYPSSRSRVPLITPVDELSVRPAGKTPLERLKTSGAWPPEVATVEV